MCSVFSRAVRIPPFVQVKNNNFSYLKMFSELSTHDSIMKLGDKNLFVVPLEDSRIQIIIIPQSSLPATLNSLSLDLQVKSLMKDINEDQIVKVKSLSIPSFNIDVVN